MLREALCVTIPFGREDDALTREEIWQRLPEEIRVNVKRFEAVLENGCGDLWVRKGAGRKGGEFRYWRMKDWSTA